MCFLPLDSAWGLCDCSPLLHRRSPSLHRHTNVDQLDSQIAVHGYTCIQMWISWTMGLQSTAQISTNKENCSSGIQKSDSARYMNLAPLSALGHNKHKSPHDTLMIPDPSFMKLSPEVKQGAKWYMEGGGGGGNKQWGKPEHPRAINNFLM